MLVTNVPGAVNSALQFGAYTGASPIGTSLVSGQLPNTNEILNNALAGGVAGFGLGELAPFIAPSAGGLSSAESKVAMSGLSAAAATGYTNLASLLTTGQLASTESDVLAAATGAAMPLLGNPFEKQDILSNTGNPRVVDDIAKGTRLDQLAPTPQSEALTLPEPGSFGDQPLGKLGELQDAIARAASRVGGYINGSGAPKIETPMSYSPRTTGDVDVVAPTEQPKFDTLSHHQLRQLKQNPHGVKC